MAHTPELAALLDRAQRACAALAILRDEVAITRVETQRLIALARQASSADGRIAPAPPIPLVVEEPPTEVDPHLLAMEVLRMMRELLNGFPVEWQVTIVKAITARTMLIVAAQMHKPPITPTA